MWENNTYKRLETKNNGGKRVVPKQIQITILKEMVPQGLPPNAKRELIQVGQFDFDGMKDFVFCSNDVNEEHGYEKKTDDYHVVCIRDPTIA